MKGTTANREVISPLDDWSDPVEDDVLGALEHVIRAQIALIEAEGDPNQVRRLDNARSELEAFSAAWRA